MSQRPVLIQFCDVPDRFIPGDRLVRGVIRKAIGRSDKHLSGVRRVVRNFLIGLERKGIPYRYNPLPFRRNNRPLISFGQGEMGLRGVSSGTPLIAAVSFPHPKDFPELSEQYDLRYFLQHSQWGLDLVRSGNIYNASVFGLWPAGVDTDEWSPAGVDKTLDIIVYVKIHWDKKSWSKRLVDLIINSLVSRGLVVTRIVYGEYEPGEYKHLLSIAKAMVFLSPHESQGFACIEAMSSGVPIFAWDPGFWLDPDQERLGLSQVPATSVPFFDERCGATFRDAAAFESDFDEFWEDVSIGHLRPRDYVIENVSIERSTDQMLAYYDEL
jgi:hypothetical protein